MKLHFNASGGIITFLKTLIIQTKQILGLLNRAVKGKGCFGAINIIPLPSSCALLWYFFSNLILSCILHMEKDKQFWHCIFLRQNQDCLPLAICLEKSNRNSRATDPFFLSLLSAHCNSLCMIHSYSYFHIYLKPLQLPVINSVARTSLELQDLGCEIPVDHLRAVKTQMTTWEQ